MNRSSGRLAGSTLLLMIAAVLLSAQQSTTNNATPQGAAQQTSNAIMQPPPAEQAQTQVAEATGPANVLKVKTRLVVVDVVALDHKGVPVSDLKSGDFSLLEDGKEQKVRVFSFQRPADTASGQPVMEQAALPPNRITNIPRFKTNRALSVLLLDGINVTNANQKYTREQMLKFLEKLPAGQPLAVYALGTKLRMLQDFTTDPALLREAVKKARVNSLGVRADISNAAVVPPGMMNEPALDAILQSVLRFGQDQVINQMDERVRLTLAQLDALSRNLAGYPGRKNVIWLSEAFPNFFVPSTFDMNGKNSTGISGALQPIVKSYQPQINHTADLLANAQVAVYPVDAGTIGNRDVYSNMSNTDSNGNYLGNSARGVTRQSPGSQQANEINRSVDNSIDSHSTMNSVAEQTGGRAYYNTNNIEKAIREGMDDGATYYTLGYYPENKDWDGRFRKIVVKVNRPGIKLHYRQGFFAVEPKDYLKQDAKLQGVDIGNALNVENPVATALGFQAMVIPPSAGSNKVQINFGIDPHAISFELRQDGLQHASVDCGVRVYTQKGESVRIQGNTFDTRLTPDQFQKVMRRFFPCNQSLELPPGDYILRLVVRDDFNGLIGTANGHITIPATAAQGAANPEEKKP